jgi:hypothetical protein
VVKVRPTGDAAELACALVESGTDEPSRAVIASTPGSVEQLRLRRGQLPSIAAAENRAQMAGHGGFLPLRYP